MCRVDEKKIYRIIDANFNRAKEGLRVCEDVCRFILDAKELTRAFKDVRHRLTGVMSPWGLPRLIECRDIGRDVGKKDTGAEFSRTKVRDIFDANIQRVKESIRVLEEFSKLKNKKAAQDLKKLRYRIYALEAKVIAGC